jgi:LmbE family N-acetylglucosaminyl deacetylase
MSHQGVSPLCATQRLDAAQWRPMRALVVAAHPDDETIGLGASMGEWAKAGSSIEILIVTDGAPQDPQLRPTLADRSRAAAAQARQQEVIAALRQGELAPERVLRGSLGVPDQQAASHLLEIARELLKLLSGSQFDVVFTHPYEGGHPDHDAMAFAVHAAVVRCNQQGGPVTALAEFASYHAKGEALAVAQFLPCAARALNPDCWRCGILSASAYARRRSMLDAYVSQREVLATFDRGREPVRCAPVYDFTQPPHSGALHYERLGFGWTGTRWRELARSALGAMTHL